MCRTSARTSVKLCVKIAISHHYVVKKKNYLYTLLTAMAIEDASSRFIMIFDATRWILQKGNTLPN